MFKPLEREITTFARLGNGGLIIQGSYSGRICCGAKCRECRLANIEINAGMYAIGTFETSQRTVTMSAYRGRPEVIGTRLDRRE